MTDAALTLSHAERNRAIGGLFAATAIWTTAFLGGFVLFEPAPYELFLAGLIAIWLLFGLRLPQEIAPVIVLLMVFNAGGVISMMTMADWKDAPMYLAVGFFLALTAIFFAAIIAADWRRLAIIMNGYVVGALVTGLLGIAGYFGAIPGAEMFTRYGRAMGVFQDPNVFAPYLALPTLFVLYGLLTQPLTSMLWRLPVLLVLTFATFLSFSRAGWGHFALSVMMLVGFLLIASPSTRLRLRVLTLSIIALVTLIVGLLIALQFESVRDVFVVRAQLVQDYDSAQLGRFARYAIGFMKATEHPFGIGPLEFGQVFGEDTHNIWLKALFDYSWLGFAAYVTLVVWTLAAGARIVFRDRPWQPFLACALIVFFGHMLIGNVIDTDRWRHLYLALGMIWGCIALEANHQRARKQWHPEKGHPAAL